MACDSIRQMSAWLADSDIDLLELRGPGVLLRLHRDGAVVDIEPRAAATHATRPQQALGQTVSAPSVGVFLAAHPLQTTALARPGVRVRLGEPIGLLQIGALLLPVCAPANATVGAVLVASGTLVGYGTPLFDLEPW